ncbi:ABC transporter substrate-binding protein [Enterococcus silesiacus]|uniref:ABC transporter substrate-binding protein n=1 Tax=Enterococcus silesiacus TaxID=332949 RepID=A0A0S3KAC2_9ENTE|nr:ABC transporter substrate-binding protein [Enterococcus silesiacus]ALS01212.1 ABC transporter substrate-binding protein [Enterococcus silesiacus]OJG92612.1 ABC transporter substrate-binding protein [Enterococcus silesiacus]
MKKFLGSLLVLASALMLTACGGAGSSKDADAGSTNNGSSEKITLWAWDETFNIKAAEIAKEYYENKDVTVEVVTMSQNDIVQKLNTSLASGNTEGLPNIVLIEDYRIQSYLTSYPDAFSDLGSIVKEKDFSDYKFAVNKVDDKIYGVPFDSGVAGIFYRRDYFEEAGYKEADLQDINWDDLIKIARVVKDKTGHALMTMDPSDLGLTRIIMQSTGKWFTDESGEKVTLKGNKALEYALKIQATILKEGLAEQVSDWDGGVNGVQSGSVASAIQGCWYASTIQGAEDQTGKWGIAPIPVIKGDANSKHSSNIGGGGWYVIKGLPGEEQAKEFLGQTFASNVDLMNQLAKEVGVISTLKAASKSPIYQEGVAFYDGQKVFEDFSNWSAEVPKVNYGKDTYAIESILTESLQEVINGGDVDKVLTNVQKQAEDQLEN